MSQKITDKMGIQVSVPARIYAEIDAHAVANCTTKAAIVRKVLTQWLDDLDANERLSNRVE
jgi:hypothetical protein